MVTFQNGKRLENGGIELLGFKTLSIINDREEKDSVVVSEPCTKEEMDVYHKTGYFKGMKAEGL